MVQNRLMYVIDTNVPKLANDKYGFSIECIMNCIKYLRKIINDEAKVVIDDKWLILKEYRNNLSASGEPGIGDHFFRWILTNQKNSERCIQLSLIPDQSNKTNYEVFKSDLNKLPADPADIKFLAVAFFADGKAPILEATDCKWWGWQKSLEKHAIRIEFLCEKEIIENYRKKFPGAVKN